MASCDMRMIGGAAADVDVPVIQHRMSVYRCLREELQEIRERLVCCKWSEKMRCMWLRVLPGEVVVAVDRAAECRSRLGRLG